MREINRANMTRKQKITFLTPSILIGKIDHKEAKPFDLSNPILGLELILIGKIDHKEAKPFDLSESYTRIKVNIDCETI